MGGHKRNSTGNLIFTTVIDGEFRVKAKEGDAGAAQRDKKDKEGNVIGKAWYQIYDDIDGKIAGIEVKYNDHIKTDVFELNLVTDDAPDEVWQLQLKLSNPYLSNLCDRLISKEVDLANDVRLSAYEMERDGKKPLKGIVIYQNSSPILNDWAKKVESVHNFENKDPDSPVWDEAFRTDKRKMANWKLDMEDYIKKIINDQIIPKLVPIGAADTPFVSNEPAPPPSQELPPAEEETDLPF